MMRRTLYSTLLYFSLATCYQPTSRKESPSHGSFSRRSFLTTSTAATSSIPLLQLLFLPPPAAYAQDKSAQIAPIQEARDTLKTLLDNWEKAVIDCTYADVPRELLETKNKGQLLEKASTFALFDKSSSVVSCKTNNRIVRDYIGSTGKGPLVGIDKKLRLALDAVDNSDDVEVYLQTLEEVQEALSKANSLSYTAGVADLSSVNNFEKEEIDKILASNNNLQEAKSAIQAALDGLDRILGILK